MCLHLEKQGDKASVYPGLTLSLATLFVMTQGFFSHISESNKKYFQSIMEDIGELSKNPFQCNSNGNIPILNGDYFLHSVTVLQLGNLTFSGQHDFCSQTLKVNQVLQICPLLRVRGISPSDMALCLIWKQYIVYASTYIRKMTSQQQIQNLSSLVTPDISY